MSKIWTQIIISTVAVAALILFIAFFVSKMITNALGKAVVMARELSEGNLALEIEVDSRRRSRSITFRNEEYDGEVEGHCDRCQECRG